MPIDVVEGSLEVYLKQSRRQVGGAKVVRKSVSSEEIVHYRPVLDEGRLKRVDQSAQDKLKAVG